MTPTRRTLLLAVAALVADGLPAPVEVRENNAGELWCLRFETNADQAAWRPALQAGEAIENVYLPEWHDGEICSHISYGKLHGVDVQMSSWEPVEARDDSEAAAKVRAALATDLTRGDGEVAGSSSGVGDPATAPTETDAGGPRMTPPADGAHEPAPLLTGAHQRPPAPVGVGDGAAVSPDGRGAGVD